MAENRNGILALLAQQAPQSSRSLGGLLGLKMAPGNGMGIAPYGIRHDGTGAKGKGFLGLLPTPDGSVATEYSMEGDVGGRNMEFPSIVPTLSSAELQGVLSGNISDDVYRKALAHALMRVNSGQSPFMENTGLRQTRSLADLLGTEPYKNGR